MFIVITAQLHVRTITPLLPELAFLFSSPNVRFRFRFHNPRRRTRRNRPTLHPHSSPPLHLPCVRRWSRRSNGGGAGSLPLAHLRCLGFPPPAASSNPGDGGSNRRSNPGRGGSDSLPRFFAAPHRSPRAFWGRSIATRPEASGYRELAVFSLPFFPVCVPDAEKQWIILPRQVLEVNLESFHCFILLCVNFCYVAAYSLHACR